MIIGASPWANFTQNLLHDGLIFADRNSPKEFNALPLLTHDIPLILRETRRSMLIPHSAPVTRKPSIRQVDHFAPGNRATGRIAGMQSVRQPVPYPLLCRPCQER